MDSLIIVSITALAITAYSAVVIIRQQRSIDRLTDKLMARDYGEYKRHERIMTTPDDRQRKPMSYYDDPSVETEDEVQ